MTSIQRVCALSEISPGTMKRVTVQGRDALLVNVGGELSAIGADCPHAGGPLDEGELEGEVVECPWHGSQFSVKTGELVRGPAIDPVNKYEVIVRGEDVLVNVARRGAEV